MTISRDLPVDIFLISTGTSEPIYRQMVEQLRRQILGGQVRAGDAMPSVREVASTLGVNPMTVSKAYSLLEADGWLARRRGMGMIVAQRESQFEQAESRLQLIRPSLEQVALESQQLKLAPDDVLQLFSQILRSDS
ncbi:GntR family transcriptional regulator [Undibacterium flavidum]|uniref:GntR family transcriptional regulator n=1 Tax=Undibacterium flavidum TaxID=2762297 RepID=A0ABR6YFJ3_9BURK|nr:GntR family transcriptional regulator [Undibacterium flavidum]MBC3875335.1 GntR family transcriptional regulator [Undibacterium flavidum]